ncbi:Fic family protein [Candidatus Poriferisocius sp.]|uniref:Fic family protein n=1 Tax=Candidatus Poriferisocius sp. TaxID=3101276 RepID=UPI003B01C72D
MSVKGWPAAGRRAVVVDNELYRPWIDDSEPRITVVQTVPAAIADQPVPPPGRHATQAVEAARDEIGRLRAHSGNATGVLGHLSAVLIRADAVASSQIEQITTSSEALAVALADLGDEGADPVPRGTELVAANVATALHAFRSDEAVDVEWFHRRHRSLLAADSEMLPRYLGAWRDCAVWIGENRQTADFEGPPHDQVAALMDDLVRFAARRDLHPVIHAAIAHAQFETIHPYVDGNGRVGRLLIHPLLDAGPAPVPVAHGLLHDPAGYVGGLSAYRAGDVDAWVAAFAAAVADGAIAAIRLVGRIDDLRQAFRDRIRTRAGSAVDHILDSLIHTPAITARHIQETYGVTPGRASQILHQLAEADVLRSSTHRADRSQVWVAHHVIDAIDTINTTLPRRHLPTP